MSSANISNNSPDYTIHEILNDFNKKVDFILDDGKIYGSPSTIVKVENNEIRIIREGNISINDINKCFGGKINVK